MQSSGGELIGLEDDEADFAIHSTGFLKRVKPMIAKELDLVCWIPTGKLVLESMVQLRAWQ
ncbi:MAG: hypothetical protein ACKOOE_08650 [Micrococcales bacterium]